MSSSGQPPSPEGRNFLLDWARIDQIWTTVRVLGLGICATICFCVLVFWVKDILLAYLAEPGWLTATLACLALLVPPGIFAGIFAVLMRRLKHTLKAIEKQLEPPKQAKPSVPTTGSSEGSST